MNPTTTQRALIEAATKHPQHKLVDFPANLKGGARAKVLTSLCGAGWIKPCDNDKNVYELTPTGMLVIGAKTEAPKTLREGTKQSTLIELLKRPQGATLKEMIEATGWQQHTIRGAMAGALKKKLGLNIVSEKTDGQERKYRIV
jgi:predicted transcriptional regulator